VLNLSTTNVANVQNSKNTLFATTVISIFWIDKLCDKNYVDNLCDTNYVDKFCDKIYVDVYFLLNENQ